MRIGGGNGSLLLLISVPGGIARAAGNERDGHNACHHQIAALGRHLAMAVFGFARRGNRRQGNITHGDGLVHGRRRAQAGELAGERVVDRQAVEQDGFLACVGFGLVVCLVFGAHVVGLVFSSLNAIVCVPIIGLRLVVRLALRVGPRIVKRNLAQRDLV